MQIVIFLKYFSVYTPSSFKQRWNHLENDSIHKIESRSMEPFLKHVSSYFRSLLWTRNAPLS